MRVLAGLGPAAGGRLERRAAVAYALAEALAAPCGVLLLDEPFSGLHRAGRDWLAGALDARREEGAASIFSDHDDAAGGRLTGLGSLALGGGAATSCCSPRAHARRCPRACLRMEAILVAILTGVVTPVFLGYPLILDAVVGDVYDRPVRAVDLAAGGVAHLACGVSGGAVAVLFSAPRIERRASGAAAIAAGLLALVPAGAVLGPLAVARALSDAGGDVDGAPLGAAASCTALAAAAFALGDRWTSAWS